MPAIVDRRVVLLGVLALLAPARAQAGGMEVGDNGGEAMGRGGAFVAKADSPAALNYNPAGFAKLRGHQAVVTANALRSTLDFQRAGDGRLPASSGLDAYPLVQNAKPWFVVPMHLVVTTDFGFFDRLTFAAGFYGPSVASHEYASSLSVRGQELAAPQRFDSVSTGGLIMFPSIGVGWRVHEMLDIGVTFQWMMSRIQTRTLATVGAACAQAEDPACDVVMDVEAENWFAPTGSLGVLFRPSRRFELGTMVRFPSSAELGGKAKVSFGPKVKELEQHFRYKMLDPEEPRITLTNSYPWMFRIGARYVWRSGSEEVGDLEVDLAYEAWSLVSKHTVQIEATSLNKPLKPIEMDWKLLDTYGIRLGGSRTFRLTRDLSLTARAGGFGETQATGVSDTSLQVFAAPKLGITAGVGLKWRQLSLDLAYAHVFLPDRKVQQSTVRASDFGGGQGPVVGNGRYEASMDGIYLQLTGSLGADRLTRRRGEDPPERVAEPARRAELDRPRAAVASTASERSGSLEYEASSAAAPAAAEPEMTFDGASLELSSMTFAGASVKLSPRAKRVRGRSRPDCVRPTWPGTSGHRLARAQSSSRLPAGPGCRRSRR